ncbi:MAG: response regulator transcription factor [Spirochaetaceae bacterium]|jgi:DNA-binding response OmpR family regulator|nr:response regulator transcription factor [Spirochaetaceae bacterium]
MAGDGLILVVDDERRIAELLKAYLERSAFKVICAATGREALAAFEQYPVSLMLLDLMLPDITGEAVCRRVRESSSIPIIMLTAKADEESIIKGLSVGADDYITKPFSMKQVVARVQAALRRSILHAPPNTKKLYLKYGELELDGERRLIIKNGVPLSLSAEEYKILCLLMSNGAKIFTRDEIIDKIKGEDFDGFDRTIDAQIKNIRKKIGDDSKNARYIQTVYGLGYRFIGEEGVMGNGNSSSY